MRIPDAIIGAACATGGVAVFVATTRFPRQTDGAPGPALFPQVLAVLLVLCGVALAAGALARRAAAPAGDRVGVDVRGAGHAVAVLAAIVFFMVAGPALGFLFTSALVLFGLMWLLGTPPLRALLASVGMTLFVYLLFGKALRVPLPLGVFWF